MLDCAIIGAGPAGLTAGLYTTRGGLENVVMFELGLAGGQITQSSEIENYPGVNEVVTGMELMESWPKQASKFGLETKMAQVEQVSKKDNYFTIKLEDGTEYESKTVFVATGSRPKKAKFKGEDEFFGKGVSTCATCDGFFYRNREVAILGGGDTALEEALYLANICTKVYLIHRRDSFKASPATVKRVMAESKIEILLNYSIDEVYGDEMGVTGLKILNSKDNSIKDLEVPGLFVFVGRDVMNQVLKQDNGSYLCELNSSGEVIVDLKMRTSCSGLFAGGDIRIDAAKQVVCAAGDGATAGVEIINYLEHNK